jgi:uncharacterized protein (DUF58 family)|tara:strand:+ start:1356 stop:2357 length:1002 start_codon:yes stop_codon:yes gene_type:complete
MPVNAAETTGRDAASGRFSRQFSRWLVRRIPPARSITLDQRRIFIFPSLPGFFFFVLLLLILLTAINYQNNMAYAVAFLLATLFVVSILHTYANLAGLTLHALSATPAFPGQRSEFRLRLQRSGKAAHYALRLSWPQGSDSLVSLADRDSCEVSLYVPVGNRGWHNPGRLLLESRYPLGLLRCWTWLDLDLQALVYPRPLATAAPPGGDGGRPEGNAVETAGSDDFHGFRSYRPGDSLRQVHWKAVARGHSLQSKVYAAYASRTAWLDWDAFPGIATEQRLSYLCYWALALERRGEDYGLSLPGVDIAPASGEAHQGRILAALALYQHGAAAS